MRVQIRNLHLLDGTKIQFEEQGGLYIISGPNNSGKTKFLLDAYQSLAGTVVVRGGVIGMSELLKEGSHEELVERLEGVGIKGPSGWNFTGLSISGNFEGFFQMSGMNSLERVLALQLTTATRLSMVAPPNSIDYATEPKSHPLHLLYRNKDLRQKLSRWFKRAFGTEIGMDMLGGRVIPLHVGAGAEPIRDETVIDESYLTRLRSLPRLEAQGDGMKSFVGIILYVLLGQFDMIFLDEPEAFLHPPQARLLGNIVGKERPGNIQLFIATHSADFIRGALESSDATLRITRISRRGDEARLAELTREEIARSWSDPILRFSNVIDGIFHEKVILCEADGDCRFYSAVADVLRSPEDHSYARDTMFLQAGGKGGIPKLIIALRALEVPVSAVVDFDIFRQVGQLKAIIEALGESYSEFVDDITVVRGDIDKLGVQPTVRDIKQEVQRILSEVDDEAQELSRGVEKRLRDAVKAPPGWARAKTAGLGVLSRAARDTGSRLLDRFTRIGLHVVPVGEIESFEPSETANKNEWVNAVLAAHAHDMATAAPLSSARDFVTSLITL